MLTFEDLRFWGFAFDHMTEVVLAFLSEWVGAAVMGESRGGGSGGTRGGCGHEGGKNEPEVPGEAAHMADLRSAKE